MFARKKRQEIMRRLDRIEGTLVKILDEVEKGKILRCAQDDKGTQGEDSDKWLQEGLSNIMAFQAGGKKGKKE